MRLQEKLTPQQELAAMDLSTDVASTPATGSAMARRLLGPNFRFVASQRVDHKGKKEISLATYTDMVNDRRLASLGLTF